MGKLLNHATSYALPDGAFSAIPTSGCNRKYLTKSTFMEVG